MSDNSIESQEEQPQSFVEKPDVHSEQQVRDFNYLKDAFKKHRNKAGDLLRALAENKGFGSARKDVAKEFYKNEQESERDGLTDLLNRKGFDRKLRELASKAAHEGTSLAVVLMDANNLRELNNTEGHEVGDAYLKRIGQDLKKSTRSYEAASRWGGDEFAAIFQGVPPEHIAAWWDRADHAFMQDDESGRKVSIGAGIVNITPEQMIAIGRLDEKGMEQFIKQLKTQADAMLYKAKPLSKEEGRNVIMTLVTNEDGTQSPIELHDSLAPKTD